VAGEPAVEPQADKPPQTIAVAVEERSQGRLIADQGAPEEKARVVRWFGHGTAP
jgi:hypothetical protein